MEWFFFLLMGGIFFISLYWIREKYTIFRLFLFASTTLLFGLLLTSGINFPSGTSIVTVGATTTQTTTYTTYTAELSGTNSFPILYGISWGMIITGILGLLYSLLEVFRWVYAPNDKPVRML